LPPPPTFSDQSYAYGNATFEEELRFDVLRPVYSDQLNSTRRRVKLSCVAINGTLETTVLSLYIGSAYITDTIRTVCFMQSIPAEYINRTMVVRGFRSSGRDIMAHDKVRAAIMSIK